MKARTLSAVAFTSLLALGGTAFAADSPHDAYYRAFGGDQGTPTGVQGGDTMGKAAYGTPSGTSLWDGHEAYNRAFFGASPQKPQTGAMGKAADSIGNATIDGNAAYHGVFRGD